MKKVLTLVVFSALCSGLVAEQAKTLTFKEKAKIYYNSVVSKISSVKKEHLKIAGVAVAGTAALAGSYCGLKKYLDHKKVESGIESDVELSD